MVGALFTVIPPAVFYVLARRQFSTAIARMMGSVGRTGA
jgi:ABC-type glycerol-3-phosphate transport system permease component